MPARSQLQQRKAQEAQRDGAWATRLAAHKPAAAATPDAMTLANELARAHPLQVFRDPTTLNRRVRSKNVDKIRLLAADHVFGRYPVAPHIRSVWCEAQDRPTEAAQRALKLRKGVYLSAASGASAHRLWTHAFMTKKETHRFLNLTHTDSFIEALWFTLASSHTDDVGVARRMSVSRIVEQPCEDDFWREVLRFFCVNPLPIAQVNDMIDFLRQEHAANPAYSVRGRTVASLTEQVEQWHRALARAKRMGDTRWLGADLPDALFLNEVTLKGKHFDWRFDQIKTSHALAEEGTKMHHCVYSYQQFCIDGRTSIWSLKTRAAGSAAAWTRALTIEMHNALRRLVQLRGYANRAMTPDERQIVSKWASENGLSVDHAA